MVHFNTLYLLRKSNIGSAMETTGKFKMIVIIILSSLVILFLFNLYYLKGLYDGIKIDTEKVVFSCIDVADNEEMQQRLDSLSTSSVEEREINIQKKFDYDFTQEVADTTMSITDDDETDFLTREQSNDLSESYSSIAQVINAMKWAMHQNIDVIIPVNIYSFDSLLTLQFEKRGILAKVYYTEIIDLNTNEVLSSSNKGLSLSQPEIFDYVYNEEGNFAYKIYLSSLTGTILYQMSGILLSTLLIIIVLSYAFYFLIKTVMQQRTLEEMKTDFVNNITHELKTPIAAAYAATDALLNFKQGDRKEKRDEYLRMSLEQLSHLSGLVEQILSMSMERRKFITLNKEDIEMKPLIYHIIEQHNLKTAREVDYKVNIMPENITVHADRIHFHNILSNLVDNAIKYSPDKVVVELNVYKEEESVVIIVKDSGMGIDAGNLNHIFEKFYRVPHGNIQNVKGYGLGLFYVKAMVEKHNGTITADSVLKHGSTFTIKIPDKN